LAGQAHALPSQFGYIIKVGGVIYIDWNGKALIGKGIRREVLIYPGGREIKEGRKITLP